MEWNSGLIERLEFVASMGVRLLVLLRGVLLGRCSRNLRRLFMRVFSALLDDFFSMRFLDMFLGMGLLLVQDQL
jgi:hypothetical protein